VAWHWLHSGVSLGSLFCWFTLMAGGHPMLGIAASVCITVPVAEQFPAAQSQQFSVAF